MSEKPRTLDDLLGPLDITNYPTLEKDYVERYDFTPTGRKFYSARLSNVENIKKMTEGVHYTRTQMPWETYLKK